MQINYKENSVKEFSIEKLEGQPFAVVLQIPSKDLIVHLTDEDNENFEQSIKEGVKLLIDSSNYATFRLVRLINALSQWFNYAEKEQLIDSNLKFKEVLIKEENKFIQMDYDLEKDLSDLYYIARAWNKDLKDIIKDFESSNDTPAVLDGHLTWFSPDKLKLYDLDEDERKALNKGKVTMTNATTLVGLTKPEYFHNGEMRFNFYKALGFTLKDDECFELLTHYISTSEFAILSQAQELWKKVELIQKGCSVLLNLSKQYGMYEDYDFYSHDKDNKLHHPDNISALIYEFGLAFRTPEGMSQFLLEREAQTVKENTSISISLG